MDRARSNAMEIEIGRITHYFDHLQVAVIKLNETLKLGDKIHIIEIGRASCRERV